MCIFIKLFARKSYFLSLRRLNSCQYLNIIWISEDIRIVNLRCNMYLPYPSAILLGMDRAARLIWGVKPKPSFLGNVFVAL